MQGLFYLKPFTVFIPHERMKGTKDTISQYFSRVGTSAFKLH